MRLRHVSAALLALLVAAPLAAQTARPGELPARPALLPAPADAARSGIDFEMFSGILSGAKEVPAAATAARGATVAAFDRETRELQVSILVQDLEGRYLFSHVHEGAAGTNGPVILNAISDGMLRDGYREIWIEGTLTPAQVVSLDAGNLYVNVHSSTFPGGELRSQLGRSVSFDEARTAGPGATVTVFGLVQRARGAFTYLTDLSGGLTVRQTASAWRDAVASGEIAGGRYVRLTGTISQFRGLLQFNQASATANDLASFEVGPELDANINVIGLINSFPLAGLELTLADIAARGEEFEGQLVVVRNVTLGGGVGGTFAAAQNVSVSDGSSPATVVVARVPNAADTEIAGRPIPTVPVTLLAIVGQFTTATPAVDGYQLLLIGVNDVDPQASVQVVHNAPDPALSVVDVAVNGAVAFDNLAFRTASPTVQLGAFEIVALEVRDSSTGATLVSSGAILVADDGRTGATIIAAQGVADPGQFLPNPDGIPTFVDLFGYPAARRPASGRVGVRVVHGSPDGPTVDVRTGQTVLVDDVMYTDFGGFSTAAAPLVRLDLTAASGSPILAQFDVTFAGLADQRIVTFASGFVNPAANQNGPGLALLTVLADGTAFTVAPRPVSADDAPAAERLAVRPGANPVRARTDLSVVLPDAGAARLSVFDALGREVAVLLDGERPAGTHAVGFDASRLAPGVYTLRLVSAGQSATSRVTVVR